MDTEVFVPLQVVGEEADAALQGDEPGAPGQVVQLGGGEGPVGPLQEALGIGIKQVQVEVDLVHVPLVLVAVVGAEPDGVAEVVDRQAGHHGIQVDDAHRLAGLAVHQHIVQLGVVVGDPQGQLSPTQGLQHHGTVGLPGGYKVQLGAYLLHSSHRIGGHHFLQPGQPGLGVVEVGDGLVQSLRRVVLQHPLELAEGPGRGGKPLRRLGGLEAHGVLQEGVHPPGAPLGVGMVVAAVPGDAQGEGLPLRIAPLGGNLLFQVVGDPRNVGHHLFRVVEGVAGDPLEDKPAAGVLPRLGVDAEGVVDVAGAKPHRAHHFSSKVKGIQGLL